MAALPTYTPKLHHLALVCALLGGGSLAHADKPGATTASGDAAIQTAAITAPASDAASAPSPNAQELGEILTVRPVPGELSSPFGWRTDPVKRKGRRKHKGIDFVADRGTLVHAAGPGLVVKARRSGGYGRMVVIDHGDGLETRYAHLHKLEVKEGQFIPAGTVVGKVGSTGRATGPHLHFEVRRDGKALPPGDVAGFELPACSKRARDCKRKRKQRPARREPTPNT